MTNEIKDESAVSSEIRDESPVRFVHSGGVAVLDGVGGAETPLESDDDEDGEDEAEGSNEHRFRQASPGNEGGGRFARGRIGRGDVPEGRDEGATGEE